MPFILIGIKLNFLLTLRKFMFWCPEIRNEARWASELDWTQRLKEKSFFL
jgi:hypothetical protein